MTKDSIDIQIEFNNRLLAAFEPKLFVPLADHQKQIAELEAENKRLREEVDGLAARCKDLRNVQNIFARILGKERYSESASENVLRVEELLKYVTE